MYFSAIKSFTPKVKFIFTFFWFTEIAFSDNARLASPFDFKNPVWETNALTILKPSNKSDFSTKAWGTP